VLDGIYYQASSIYNKTGHNSLEND